MAVQPTHIMHIASVYTDRYKCGEEILVGGFVSIAENPSTSNHILKLR